MKRLITAFVIGLVVIQVGAASLDTIPVMPPPSAPVPSAPSPSTNNTTFRLNHMG